MPAIVYDDIFLEHKPPYSHPESPSRLQVIKSRLETEGLWQKFEIIKPDEVSDILEKVHTQDYIKEVEETKGKFGNFDADTYYSPKTYVVALMAAGGAEIGVEYSVKNKDKVFALLRPPGHHSTFSTAMGFCIFNNAAIAAEKAKSMGLQKILIVDYDIHHGNGTQEIFWKRSDVFYFSTHRYPFYPGTGRFEEIGEGEGKYFTANVPLPRDLGDTEIIKIYEEVFLPLAERFSPDIIIVSAGFDAHYLDPIGDLNLTENGFRKISEIIIKIAEKYSEGRIVFLLEGGYSLEGISSSVAEVMKAILGIEEEIQEEKTKDVKKEKTRDVRRQQNIDDILFKAKKIFNL